MSCLFFLISKHTSLSYAPNQWFSKFQLSEKAVKMYIIGRPHPQKFNTPGCGEGIKNLLVKQSPEMTLMQVIPRPTSWEVFQITEFHYALAFLFIAVSFDILSFDKHLLSTHYISGIFWDIGDTLVKKKLKFLLSWSLQPLWSKSKN